MKAKLEALVKELSERDPMLLQNRLGDTIMAERRRVLARLKQYVDEMPPDPAQPDKMTLASQLCKWCTDGDIPERRWHDGPRWGHWQLNPEYPQCHAEQIHEAFYSLEQEGESK